MIRSIIVFTLVASALAAPSLYGGLGAPLHGGSSLHAHGGSSLHGDYFGVHDHYAPAYYNYGYSVNDPYHGTNFGHKENRQGDLTTGEYFVNLPDGRLQKVSYYADKHGYHPTVTYIGQAQFPPTLKGVY